MNNSLTFKLPRFFLWHVGNRDPRTGISTPIIPIFETMRDRDDMVRSLTMHGHTVRAIDWREAFALTAPGEDGKRAFRDMAGWETRLASDWTPEKEYRYEEVEA